VTRPSPRGAPARARVDGTDVIGRKPVRPQIVTPEAVATEPVALALLRLQHSAGNRAVGSLLAREVDVADAANPDVDTSAADDEAASATLVMPDPIGVLPLLSFSFGQGNEIIVTVPSSAADPTLWQYAVSGKSLASVLLSTRGLKIRLTDAVISSMHSPSGSYLTFSLTPTKIEKARSEADKPGQSDSPS